MTKPKSALRKHPITLHLWTFKRSKRENEKIIFLESLAVRIESSNYFMVHEGKRTTEFFCDLGWYTSLISRINGVMAHTQETSQTSSLLHSIMKTGHKGVLGNPYFITSIRGQIDSKSAKVL